uniref:Uncharacterized protein n=1 Tax=Anguilla anguilla TaxID=7936 RepID=A0A0E9WBZ0_ANGAN
MIMVVMWRTKIPPRRTNMVTAEKCAWFSRGPSDIAV